MGLRKRLAKLKKKIDLLNKKTPLWYQFLSHRRLGSGVVTICMFCSLLPVHSLLSSVAETVLGSEYGNLDNLLKVLEVSRPLVRLGKPQGTHCL